MEQLSLHTVYSSPSLSAVTEWLCVWSREYIVELASSTVTPATSPWPWSCSDWVEGAPIQCTCCLTTWWVWLFFLHAAQQVLKHFRSQFIDIVDANAIVYDLKHEGIIDGGDLTNITKTSGERGQNAILHDCLLQKCTEEALMKACKIIVARDHPRMKQLGELMKSKLDGVWAITHACTSVCASCVLDPVIVLLSLRLFTRCSCRHGRLSVWCVSVVALQQVHTLPLLLVMYLFLKNDK